MNNLRLTDGIFVPVLRQRVLSFSKYIVLHFIILIKIYRILKKLKYRFHDKNFETC